MKKIIQLFCILLTTSLFAQANFTEPTTTKKRTIVLDAGHGGADTGVKKDEFQEKDIVLKIANTIKERNPYQDIDFVFLRIGDEQIIEAAKLTGLIGLINALPNGLDTVVPEGGESVSGGQKQLIALTRMIVANKKIILLDEPTASMDEGTERQIISMLHQKLSPDQTMVVVTHKPIVLNMVDRIIVLTPNGIAVDGTKEEVLAKLTPKKQ